MKKFYYFLAFLVLLVSCNTNSGSETSSTTFNDGSYDSIATEDLPEPVLDKSMFNINDSIKKAEHAKTFANDAFRNVKIKEVVPGKFELNGEARVFEGTFSWAIEDGMNELKDGYVTTSAGAPEWGKFNFTVEQKKNNDNSTMHIILYESSAKDGKRLHELPIFLY